MVVDMAKPVAFLGGASRAVEVVAAIRGAAGEAMLPERKHGTPLAGQSWSSGPRESGWAA